jgi:pimeloyl-ACP methyl ester carboxylesterase
MRFERNGVSLHYEEWGSGMPVLMLHGFSLDHQMMVGCMEPLFERRSGFRRVYVDLPGMGKSLGGERIQGSDDVLDFLLAFVDEKIPESRFLVVGYSYGGYLARGILQKRRERVAGMALVCPTIIPEKEGRILPEHKVLFQDDALLATLPLEERELFASLAVVQDAYHLRRFREELYLPSKQVDLRVLARIKRNYAFSFDPDRLDAPYDGLVLILVGRQDAVVGYRDAWNLIENYPRSTFAVLDRAGHHLQIEQNMLFYALMEEWLKRVEETEFNR